MKTKLGDLILISLALLLLLLVAGAGSGASAGHSAGLNASLAGLSTSCQAPSAHVDASAGSLSGGSPGDGLSAGYAGLAVSASCVSRARDQIDQNENRNAILKFIQDHPGSTQYDLVRALGMNIGTVRYHLMILGLNHRVVAYPDGARLVRYFANNGIYSPGQMEVLSLLKRSPTGKLLSALAGEPDGMTSAKLSRASGLSYSNVNRNLKELTSKGIVVQDAAGSSRYTYRLAPEQADYISGLTK